MKLSQSAIYRSFWQQKEVVKQFGDIGVDKVCVFPGNTLNSLGGPYSAYPPNWIHQGVYDWNIVDKQFDDVIEANPKAKIFCMVDLNTPPWMTRWCREREDSFTHLGKIAASEQWRKLTDEYLEAILKHVEEKYGERLFAYSLMCGMTDEWQDFAKGEESPCRLAAWRKWCSEKGYGDPVDIPPKSQRDRCSHGLLRDPKTDAIGIHYWDFTRWLIADSIIHFASKAQETIKHRVSVGVFYGYIMEHGKGRLISEGHLGFDAVYASPDIDFIISPASYQDRDMGGSCALMLPADSLKLRGKGFIYEIDHRTHTANFNPLAALGLKAMDWMGGWLDEKSSIAGLRREYAFAQINGLSFWWFDMWNHWYDTEAMMSALSGMQKIFSRQQELGEAKSATQIAVIVDAESCLYLNEHHDSINDVLYTLRLELGRIGTSHSVFSFADIEKIDFSQFKLVLLPNLFLGGQDRIEKMKKAFMKDGKTILWLHQAGVIADGKYDESNIELLTGVPFAKGKTGSKDFGSWKSVLHSDLKPSIEFLRAVAKSAGVHLYGEGGEPVYANSRLLAAHTAKGGLRKFRLPRRCKTIRELFSNRVVAANCDEFEDELKSPDTVLYELEWE